MLSARMTAILRELMRAKTFVTGEYLANFIQVSSRTIRNEIKELETLLAANGGVLKSIRGTGYQLAVTDENKFRSFLQANLDETGPGEQAAPTMPEERVHFLIKRLLLAEGYIKIDDLADEMFVSKSTIQNDLRDVKKILEKYKIMLDKRPNYGLKLKGDELNLRFCMSEYVFNRIGTHPAINNIGVSILTEAELADIREIILAQINPAGIVLSDVGLNNLVIHIAIAYKRIQNGNYVSLSQKELDEVTKQKEYRVAAAIIGEIASKLDVVFPVSEIAYIAIHLLGTRMTVSPSLEEESAENVVEPRLQDLTRKILDLVDKKLSLGISQDLELITALCLHLKPAINRFRYEMNLRNPMLAEIKENYPIAFEAGVIAGTVIKDELGIEINEHEIGYIALHIGAAMERRKMANQPKNCLIVCASGMGSARLLSYKLQSEFGSKLNIIGTSEYYKLRETPLHNIDLIISTIPIRDSLPIPVVEVNTFLGGKDLKKIEEAIRAVKDQRADFIREELVFLQKNLDTQEEIITFLVGKMEELELVNESFVHSVKEREALSPTSFGNLVAIPHPMAPVTDHTFLAICTLQKPVKWGDKRVQFICLLSVEKDSTGEFKELYDLLWNVVDDVDKVHRLLKCTDYLEFRSIFLKEKI
ncbi:transcription antiterminator [Mesobacillus foraminis]|uniref:BglG family transcription antiterminator n=1 Tax=Mesobacillus foraminis TaxID=279826 RepID=UPI001BE75913|nr:BglG family transcription antiterminator [Mesobacillus foraminis]MBT2758206.1 transcription antiterminator [Mesobacillus foraminis]